MKNLAWYTPSAHVRNFPGFRVTISYTVFAPILAAKKQFVIFDSDKDKGSVKELSIMFINLPYICSLILYSTTTDSDDIIMSSVTLKVCNEGILNSKTIWGTAVDCITETTSTVQPGFLIHMFTLMHPSPK